jgi:hypothetical protein
MLICAVPFVASAEETVPDGTEQTETITETSPEVEVEKTTTEIVVDYIKSHIEELSVIGTLLVTIFYEIRKHGKLTGSIGTLNNNAIAVAENSATAIKTALTEVEGIADIVKNYKDEIAALLGEIRKSAEEKKSLEETLSHVETFLKTAKLATLELSNEVAELLVLANIPNSKKDELYSRHRAAVDAIATAETVVEHTEVIEDDGSET